ncbi:MAG: hypothetical protein DRQ13_11495 [Ignavibacteriae bacterium]|nr:MAG: hypothetical protein DRQ13_11495 [Ignavibacteriota bacterium]
MRKKLYIFFAAVIFAIIFWGSISLSDNYYATFDVALKLVDFPGGYTTGSNLPDNVSIKLKGEGWKLVTLNIGAESEYRVSVESDSGLKYVNLYNNLADNRWILSETEIIDIKPDTIAFFVERIISRKIPVIVDLSLEFKPGYGLANDILVVPDSVIVSGPLSIMKELKEIPTVRKSLSSLDNKKVVNINLPKSTGITYNNNEIEVVLDVQRIVDKQFDNIPVDVLDVPQDISVVLLPNTVGCSVRGGVNVLGNLNNDKFKAFLFYSDIVNDTLGSVVPHVELPENTSLMFIKPERVRYIIKTF